MQAGGDVLQYLLIAALGFLAVLFVIRSRQQQYKGHVQQLQPKRRLRELTIGSWCRADVAQHATPDDCWLIIKDKDDGKHKVNAPHVSCARSRRVGMECAGSCS